MKSLLSFLMLPFQVTNLQSLKTQVRGITHLISHPTLLKRIIIRETQYGQRLWNKPSWVEWQIYDTCIGNVPHATAMGRDRPLNMERIEVVSEMIRSIGSNLTVLDVGCGDGAIGKPIIKMGNDVISIELPKAANIARRHGVKQVLAGDAEHLSFASNTFDIVIASEVVEHLWNPQNLLRESYRVLRPDGYLIISTPEGKAGLDYDSHKHFFTVDGLKQKLESKFTLTKTNRLKPLGAPMPTIILLFRKSSSSGL